MAGAWVDALSRCTGAGGGAYVMPHGSDTISGWKVPVVSVRIRPSMLGQRTLCHLSTTL